MDVSNEDETLSIQEKATEEEQTKETISNEDECINQNESGDAKAEKPTENSNSQDDEEKSEIATHTMDNAEKSEETDNVTDRNAEDCESSSQAVVDAVDLPKVTDIPVAKEKVEDESVASGSRTQNPVEGADNTDIVADKSIVDKPSEAMEIDEANNTSAVSGKSQIEGNTDTNTSTNNLIDSKQIEETTSEQQKVDASFEENESLQSAADKAIPVEGAVSNEVETNHADIEEVDLPMDLPMQNESEEFNMFEEKREESSSQPTEEVASMNIIEDNSVDMPPLDEVDPFESTSQDKAIINATDLDQQKEGSNEEILKDTQDTGNEMIAEPDQAMIEELGSQIEEDKDKSEENQKTDGAGPEKQLIKLKSQQFLMEPNHREEEAPTTALALEESILPEEQDKDKYVIVTSNSQNGDKVCTVCEKTVICLYLAQKDEESLYICSHECLLTFKEQQQSRLVERLLRVRVFNPEPEANLEESMPLQEFEEEKEDVVSRDPLRTCKSCSQPIDLDTYVSWEAMDFCNEWCLINFQKTVNTDCAACGKKVPDNLLGKYCVRFGTTITQFCRTTCLLNHKKQTKFCAYCQENLHVPTGEKAFCSPRCAEVDNPDPKRMLETKVCAVCHQIKVVEVKVRLSQNKTEFLCSDRCFVAYKFVNNANNLLKCIQCPTHFEQNNLEYIIYDGKLCYMICSKECQKVFLISNRKIVNCANCSVKKYDFDMIKAYDFDVVTYACSGHCLEEFFDSCYQTQVQKSEPNIQHLESIAKDIDFMFDGKTLNEIFRLSKKDESKVQMHKITLTRPKLPTKVKNMSTMCKPLMIHKSINCKRRQHSKTVQTDDKDTIWIPLPVPIFVPMPMHFYAEYVPMLTPIPLPLPVPIFIPTGRKSIKGILKEMQKIKNRIPADPLEAEILMMADHAAGDKKAPSSSESESEEPPIVMDLASASATTTTAFGDDDDISMAFNQFSADLVEPLDLEGVVDHSTISSTSSSSKMVQVMETKRRHQAMNKRPDTINRTYGRPELDKANSLLKYSFGVNAWKQWASLKNAELQKSSRKGKLIRTEILHMTTDELCAGLCSFIKEVRKPNGSEYAPDTIYYLCLGIQQYLYENGRVDNLFCDAFYEKFTCCFDEVCLKFATIYDDRQFIVTRVEEEHLWESKQLGAHSPLVLLNTLMFFNTKHFNLTTVDEHMQLSFSHIMKTWRRGSGASGASGASGTSTRNVLLRYYPPHNPEEGKKRRVFEQHEYFENPLRCPVRLYEFYLSKCPESVKTRSDVFYLQPERSCVPDSPVWYSTIPFDREHLTRMLNRIKMIKEINVALMTT